MTWSAFFWVRSAGFSFEALDGLGMLTEREDDVVRFGQWQAALGQCESCLVEMARKAAPESVAKLERRFTARAPLEMAELAAVIRDAAAPLLEARDAHLARLAECEAALCEAYERELPDCRQRIIDFIRSPQAREALYLSNPESMLRVDALLEHGGAARIDSRARQRYRLAWNYLQRLCAKNDTSSFFGPIAWGRFAGDAAPNLDMHTVPGPWLTSRKTFFEHWVVMRLADAVCADEALCDALPLELNPGCDLRGADLHVPVGKTVTLNSLGVRLIEIVKRAAQPLSARAVLEMLEAGGFVPSKSRAMLDLMRAKHVIQASFDIPPGSVEPIERLQGALLALDAPASATAVWVGICERLEALRIDFERGDLEARMAALEAMRELLSGVGVDLSRVQGQMYVGRFPVYEDCARNLHVEFGGDLERAIKDGLEPLMRLYEWLMRALAVRLHERCLAHWQLLSHKGAAVDLLTFLSSWKSADDTGESIMEAVRSMLQDGWAQVSVRHVRQDEVTLTVADFAILMAELDRHEPRAKHFMLPAACVHSPDFMVASPSLEAVRRGDFRIVVGEVHPGVHTVSQPVAQPFCPYATAIREEVEALLSPSTIVAADSPKSYQRSHIDWLDVDALAQVVLPGGGGHVARARRLRAGALELHLRDGILTCRDRASGAEQDLLTVMPTDLHRLGFALAGEVLAQSETRRLTFGRVLLKRRAWRFDDGFPQAADDPFEHAGHYLAWRSWASRRGLPSYVFVKCASEPKPIYVDFSNPFAIDLLAKWAKKGEPLLFSEMQPAPRDLWLTDEKGRYCCEFRTSHVHLGGPDTQPDPPMHGAEVCEGPA
ncbi:lantibiotic dehydratase [Trinickia violacea]|nr:lantibiotic dehydratase [Trinickia violacea]